jgi:hypothetical protein
MVLLLAGLTAVYEVFKPLSRSHYWAPPLSLGIVAIKHHKGFLKNLHF